MPSFFVCYLYILFLYERLIQNIQAMAKITVKDTEVAVIKVNDEDYICITDIARFKTIETYIVICNWMRNRNTIEYLGIRDYLNLSNSIGLEKKQD